MNRKRFALTTPFRRYASLALRVSHTVILLALILGLIGAVDAFSSNT